jgi:hypothetical protein
MLYTGKPPLKEPFSALYFSDEKQSAGGKRSKKPRELSALLTVLHTKSVTKTISI